MSTIITICDRCRRPDWTEDKEVRDGTVFAEIVEAVAAPQGVETRRFSCLGACKRACNVTVQAEGKLSYVLGDFEPDQFAAEGVVAFAKKHAEASSGMVPLKERPEAVKGHIVARLPALMVNEE